MRNFFPFMTTNPNITGIRADLIYANYIIACLLPLFVIFLCIRMVSSTKKAGALTFLLTGVFVLFHREEMQPAFISFINSIAASPWRFPELFWDARGLLVYLKGCTMKSRARTMFTSESIGMG